MGSQFEKDDLIRREKIFGKKSGRGRGGRKYINGLAWLWHPVGHAHRVWLRIDVTVDIHDYVGHLLPYSCFLAPGVATNILIDENVCVRRTGSFEMRRFCFCFYSICTGLCLEPKQSNESELGKWIDPTILSRISRWLRSLLCSKFYKFK